MEGIVLSLLSNFMYDLAKTKIGLFNTKKDNLQSEITKYVQKNISKDLMYDLTNYNLDSLLLNSQFRDLLDAYLMFRMVGNTVQDKKLSQKLDFISESELIEYLSNEIINSTSESILIKPDKLLLGKSIRSIISLVNGFFLNRLNPQSVASVFLLGNKMDMISKNIIELIESKFSILKRYKNFSFENDIIDFENSRDQYMRVLKRKFSTAQVFQLNKFDFNSFYVTPKLSIKSEKSVSKAIVDHYFYDRTKVEFSNIFYKNFIYITGGAGYGKTLFLKKIINDYETLNILDADKYLVVYSELKKFDHSKVSFNDFLYTSMRQETFMDENELPKELLDHYLKIGRCIILLDALDEVNKKDRETIHDSIINYLSVVHPNVKVCISSRSRGFIPCNNITHFEIPPLNKNQIIQYVDNIIKLDQFDGADKEIFLNQANELMKSKFLNSFLVLSLLMKIFRAERQLPETKIELYESCYSNISIKREGLILNEIIDWDKIKSLTTNNTFMELSALCYPNNKEVSRKTIVETLGKIYKSKYGNQNNAEIAINYLLDFCTDRTELFVMSNTEDYFKFFHRSFFEFFYSQYLYHRKSSIKQIFDEIIKFDVDSEVFELLIATMKKYSITKYEEMIEYVFAIINNNKQSDKEIIQSFNILTLFMQIIDELNYREAFNKIVVTNKILLSNTVKIKNNDLIFKNLIPDYYDQVVISYKNKIDEFIFDTVQIMRDFNKLKSVKENRSVEVIEKIEIDEFDIVFNAPFYILSFVNTIPPENFNDYDFISRYIDGSSLAIQNKNSLLDYFKKPYLRAQFKDYLNYIKTR